MKLLEYILSEIDIIFKKELNSRHEKQEAEELYNCIDLSTIKDEDLEDLRSFFLSHNELSKLSKTKKYIELFFDCYDENEFAFIEKQIERNTSDKILIVLWILVKRAKFSHDEFFDIELINFLDKVFSKYSFIFELDDFIEITGFFNIKFNSDDIVKEKLIPVLEKAIKDYTNNLVVIKTLINIYYKFGFLSKAEKLIDKTILELKKSDLKLHKIDVSGLYSKETIYLELTNTKALINYKLGYFDKALKATSFVIDKVISVYNNNSPSPVFNEVSILTQLSIFLKENKTEEFNESIEYLKKYWTLIILNEWEAEFPEIVTYLKDMNFENAE